MFANLLYKLRALFTDGPLSGLWVNLRYYYSGWNKGGLIFFSFFAIAIGVLAFVIYFSFIEKDRNRDLACLALNVYHEARGEPIAGQYAVAEVTLNRVASKRYPNTICEVVYQQNWDRRRKRYVGMFSWTELESNSHIERSALKRAWDIAGTVYDNKHTPHVGSALFYHANYIKPRWAKRKKPIAKIGKHIFYR